MRRRTLLATVAAAAIVLVAWYGLLWHPASGQLRHARREAATAKSQLQSLTFRATALEEQRHRLPAEEQKLTALEVSVPASAQVPQVLRDLAAIERSSGVTIQNEAQALPATTAPAPGSTQASGATATPPALQQLQLTMTVGGNYGHLMTFLSRLGQLPRSVIIQTVDIAAGGTPPAPPLSATITALAFYDPSPAPRLPN